MDMHARNEYLREIQKRYFQTRSRNEKSSILDEYCTNTHQNRKYVIGRINSSLCPPRTKRKRRKRIYDGYVRASLAQIWEIFDYPCGQRLAPLLKAEIPRLRQLEEVLISNEVAQKLKRISPRTIDRILAHQKEVLHLQRKYRRKRNPLIYQRVPLRAGSWDRSLPGQVEIDLVEHCGSSSSGLYGNTVNSCDIATGWWEAEIVLGSGQDRTSEALRKMRERAPLRWCEIHPDNDTSFINWHLVTYCEKERITLSRSRPYKKNDNAYIEQKNSTHVRSIFGHRRYDTEKELGLINDLYRHDLRLYKNFFSPVMKLKEKIRDKGKVHRRYDSPKTPYQRVLESPRVSQEEKNRLEALYRSLNPAELKRAIDTKIHMLYQAHQEKHTSQKAAFLKNQIHPSVTFYVTQRDLVRSGR